MLPHRMTAERAGVVGAHRVVRLSAIRAQVGAAEPAHKLAIQPLRRVLDAPRPVCPPHISVTTGMDVGLLGFCPPVPRARGLGACRTGLPFGVVLGVDHSRCTSGRVLLVLFDGTVVVTVLVVTVLVVTVLVVTVLVVTVLVVTILPVTALPVVFLLVPTHSGDFSAAIDTPPENVPRKPHTIVERVLITSATRPPTGRVSLLRLPNQSSRPRPPASS
jgi:hypothetical protein